MSTLKWTVDLDAKSGIATLKQFEQAQARTDKGMRDQARSAGGLNTVFGNLSKTLLGLGGILGGGFIIRGIGKMITGMADLGDNIAKTSRALGISTDSLQKFNFVAERSGISTEAMNKSMQFMIRNTADAADGFGEAIRGFEKLNLNAAELKNLRPEDMFLAITDAVNKLESSTDRAQVMYRIFGRSGIELRKITEGGTAAIADLMSRFEELGGILNKETLDASEAYKDSITDLEIAFRGLKGALAQDVLPALTSLIGVFTTLIVSAGDFKDAILSIGEAAEGVSVGPGGELIFMPAIKPTRGQLEMGFPGGGIPEGGGGPPPEEDEEEVGRFLTKEEEKNRIFAEQRRVRAEMQAEFDAEEAELRAMQEASELEQRQTYLDEFMAGEMSHLEQRIAIHQRAAQAENQINQMRAMAQQSWMGVAYTAMQIFGARSQKWMLAMIAVETGINVARALIFGHAASVKALAEVPYPANLAVSAQMLAMMWWNVAAIVAAGALKAYGTATSGGGAGGGAATVSTPIGDALVTTPTTPVGEQRGQLIINIDNFIGDEEWIDHLVERINEAGDERDVIIRGDVRAYE